MIGAGAIPELPGAYALLIQLSRAWSPGIPRLSDRKLEPGHYVYCGSAYGPGGLRARIARHLRAGKPLHWHIDRLTEVGSVIGVAVHIEGDECELVNACIRGGATSALAGFGSSDCRRCRTHLLSLPHEARGEWLKAHVGPGSELVLSL